MVHKNRCLPIVTRFVAGWCQVLKCCQTWQQNGLFVSTSVSVTSFYAATSSVVDLFATARESRCVAIERVKSVKWVSCSVDETWEPFKRFNSLCPALTAEICNPCALLSRPSLYPRYPLSSAWNLKCLIYYTVLHWTATHSIVLKIAPKPYSVYIINNATGFNSAFWTHTRFSVELSVFAKSYCIGMKNISN